MTKRSIAGLLAAAVVGGTLLVAGPAHAESCVSLPSTTGVTIEVAGQEVRVPATSGVAVCIELGGLPGLPRVDQRSTSTDVILVGGGSGGAGYVAVRYTIDGAATEHRAPIPGTGPGSDVCAVSVGLDTRDDCLVKVTFDDEVIPSLPPTPTVPPVPTLPPIPTVPPLPTVSPEPLPTVPPVETPPPDPFCPARDVCVPYGGSLLQESYDVLVERIRDLVRNLDDEIYEFLREQCIDPENIFVTCA
ncbi:MAG TPA: hypothetical protein VHN37_01195 [Actinomycetota bacterium]|nr:hypothetical protein [Actinomycetota bacterium]